MPFEYKLLLLNGPLKGREINLPEGSFTLGKDGDVLAVLHEEEQVTLSINEQGVSLGGMSSCWVNGELYSVPGLLPLGEVVDLAGQGLIFGRADDKLLLQDMPCRQERRGLKRKSSSLLFLMGLLIVLCCMIIALLLIPQPSAKVVFNSKTWLAEQLKTPDLSDINARWDSSQLVSLTGYYQRNDQFNRLLDGLRSHNILYEDNTVSIEQLLNNVRLMLSENNLDNTDVEPGNRPGTVNIFGSIHSGQQWDSTVQMLMRVPGLISWQVSNDIIQQMQSFISMLREQSLLDSVSVKLDKNRIVVAGVLDDKSRENLNKAIEEYKKTNQAALEVVVENISINNELSKYLPSPIASYGGNDSSSFIELENGTELRVGTVLANGYIIKYIDKQGIELEKNGVLTYEPLGVK